MKPSALVFVGIFLIFRKTDVSMGIYIDTDLNRRDIKILILIFTGLWIIYLPVWCIVKLVKLIISTVKDGALNAKKKRFEKDLQEYMQDYKDGYLTEEELDEIVKDYNSRDSRIGVSLTKRQPKDK